MSRWGSFFFPHLFGSCCNWSLWGFSEGLTVRHSATTQGVLTAADMHLPLYIYFTKNYHSMLILNVCVWERGQKWKTWAEMLLSAVCVFTLLCFCREDDCESVLYFLPCSVSARRWLCVSVWVCVDRGQRVTYGGYRRKLDPQLLHLGHYTQLPTHWPLTEQH